MRRSFIPVFVFTLSVYAAGPDPAGNKNVGNGKGEQFITGGCISGADCASACCAELNGVGICSGVGAQFQNGKTGCGFKDPNPALTIQAAKGQANDQNNVQSNPPGGAQSEAQNGTQNVSAPGGAKPNPDGIQNIGNGRGAQFITGNCVSNDDCASACCAQQNGAFGVCSGVGAQFQNGKTGCGFKDPNAAQTIQTARTSLNNGTPGVKPSPDGAKNVGNGKGGQFITGGCVSDADCASACCAQVNGGLGVCSGVGAQFQNGKTGCGFKDPNATQTVQDANEGKAVDSKLYGGEKAALENESDTGCPAKREVVFHG